MIAERYDIADIYADRKSCYDFWVQVHAESMLYHSLPYLEMIAELTNSDIKLFCALDDNKVIRGVLPVLSRAGVYGTVYNSLPYYGSHGAILAKDEDVRKSLLSFWNDLASKENVATATMIENIASDKSIANDIVCTLTDERIGQLTPILCNEGHETFLMDSYHSKTRNVVRKAQKQGFSVSVENDQMHFLYETHKENMEVIGGLAKEKKFFDHISKHFKVNKDYKIWVARDNDIPIAALLLFYYKDTVEYFTPVIVDEWRERQPLSLLIFEAMCDASKRGYKLWNWGGTWASQKGVYLFKNRWGAIDRPYRYFVHIQNQNIYQSTPEELLQEYPGFFVLPFNCLKGKISA